MDDIPSQPGTVYLVGAGPGDPELLTIKGLRLIDAAEVIVFDALVNPALLAYAQEGTELIDAGKRAGRAKLSQDEINEALAHHAQQGKMVVRLKGGDPYVFGRGSEEAIYLHERGIPCVSVPGITAGIAAAAYAGIPATHRRVATTCSFITGHEDPDKVQSQVDFLALAQLAKNGGTLCFYMGMKRLPLIVEQLVRHGLPAKTPAAVIRWGTLPQQQSIAAPLDELHERATEAGLGAPAIIVVGQVSAVDREALNWFEQRPLFGKTIGITRTRKQASQLHAQLEQLGGQVIEAPTIETVEPDDWQPVIDTVADIARQEWLIITSTNGVIGLAGIMESLGMDARDLARVQVATVGPATAGMLREVLGIHADLIPEEHTGGALAQALADTTPLKGTRVLLLRADIAGIDLPDQLTTAGAQVTDLPIYKTRKPDGLPAEMVEHLQRGALDWLTFTSSSTVRNFMDLIGHSRSLLDGVKIASIGPITSATARELELDVTVEAEEHTIDGLVAAICAVSEG